MFFTKIYYCFIIIVGPQQKVKILEKTQITQNYPEYFS